MKLVVILTCLLAGCAQPTPPDLSTANGRLDAVCKPLPKGGIPWTYEMIQVRNYCTSAHLDLLQAANKETQDEPGYTPRTLEELQAGWDREKFQRASDHLDVILWKNGYPIE